jgi:hypothetical protein
MSIRDVRELLATAGDRRRRLGLATLQGQPDDWNQSLTEPKSSSDEPKAFEVE